jgi:hypothetical protein
MKQELANYLPMPASLVLAENDDHPSALQRELAALRLCRPLVVLFPMQPEGCSDWQRLAISPKSTHTPFAQNSDHPTVVLKSVD